MKRKGDQMASLTTATMPHENLDVILRLERLSRQTSLVALETALEVGEDAASGRPAAKFVSAARNVASHIIRASVEMQQAVRLYR
jgi:hypothetical protein